MNKRPILSPGTRISHYEIHSVLGTGGMGEVYRAMDLRLHREIALKLLSGTAHNEESVARFEREARAAASLSHPNILAVYDFGTENGETFVAMELLEGSTLRDRMNAGPIPFSDTLDYATQISRALAAAHSKGIIHRDLKPENLFITKQGQIKVLDFGLAVIRIPERDSGTDLSQIQTAYMTQEGILLGTLPYMSPEQAEGKLVDHRSDLFSLGSILYEISSGVKPFHGDTPLALLGSILRDDPRLLTHVNPALPEVWETVVHRCLKKNPSERYTKTDELRIELESMQKQPQMEAFGNKSIAVLPLSDMSRERDQEYFCDGMAEEIINALTKLPGLKVASRVSSFQFKNQAVDVREVGKRLGVKTVLEGSVRKSGERLRIVAQLINITNGYNLWSERYDREISDVFEIQEEIAQAIVSALSLALGPGQETAFKKARVNPQAYEYYLRGRMFASRETRKGLEHAVEMYQKAIQVDSQYAAAYAGMASVFCEIYLYWDPDPPYLDRAEEASRKALELAPKLAETHTSRGYALSLQKSYAEAETEFEAALKIDPNSYDALYLYGRMLWAIGKLDRTVEFFQRAGQVRSDDSQTRTLLVSVYNSLKRPDLARKSAEEARERLEAWLDYHPDDARATYHLASVYAFLGLREKAIEYASRAISLDPTDAGTLYNVACLYSHLGEAEQSLDMLEKAINHGFNHRDWIYHDSDFDSLRSNPRFIQIMRMFD